MTIDLLTRIQRETHERLCELRGAVDEYDRLQGELRALDAAPKPPGDPVVQDIDPGLLTAPEGAPETLSVASESEPPAALEDVPEPSENVVRLGVRRPPARTRMVSPKVARLMRAPRRPALERAGVVRVGAGRDGSSSREDRWPPEGEGIDAEVEIC